MRKHKLSTVEEGQVGISPLGAIHPNNNPSPSPYLPNKNTNFYAKKKKELYFSSGDSFGKVRKMINAMRENVHI